MGTTKYTDAGISPRTTVYAERDMDRVVEMMRKIG